DFLEAEKLCETILHHDVKPGGTMRFYGDWFGRPYDNYHKIVTCKFFDGILYITFNTGQQLKIYNPDEIEMNEKELIIHQSECVEFFRHPIESTRTEGNWIVDRYGTGKMTGNSMNDGKVYQKQIDENYPAFELLSY